MMKNIILFGKPGAGKGTQAALLRDAFQLVHISTGDLFRYNIGNNTSLEPWLNPIWIKVILSRMR